MFDRFLRKAHVREKSRSRFMDPFPMIPDPEKWTHLGFSRKRVIKFRSND